MGLLPNDSRHPANQAAARAVGLPHTQPNTERPARPWGRPESFWIGQGLAALPAAIGPARRLDSRLHRCPGLCRLRGQSR